MATGGSPGCGDCKPDGLPSTGSQRVRHDESNLAPTFQRGAGPNSPRAAHLLALPSELPQPRNSPALRTEETGSRDDGQDRRKIDRHLKNLIFRVYYNILHLWYNVVYVLHKQHIDSVICRHRSTNFQIIFPYLLLLC